MLGLFRCSFDFDWHLHRLSLLRVLVLGWIPPSDTLVTLHQLAYLHIQPAPWKLSDEPPPLVTARLGYVIRWLSVHHQLRSFSVEGARVGWNQKQQTNSNNFLQALLACNEPASAVVAARLADLNRDLNPPLDPTVPCVSPICL